MIKMLSLLVSLLCLVIVLAGCSIGKYSLRVGTVPGMQADVLREVARQAEREGLHVEVIVLTDYAQPDMQLAKGELDAVSFQTEEYLAEQMAERGYDFAVLTPTILFPLGLYPSDGGQAVALDNIQPGTSILLPGDAVNASRALRLLARGSLIALSQESEKRRYVSLSDVQDNPLGLQLKESRVRPGQEEQEQSDLVILGTTLADARGYRPLSDALLLEAADCGAVQVLAVRSEQLDTPELQMLRRIYSSAETRAFVERLAQGSAVFAAF